MVPIPTISRPPGNQQDVTSYGSGGGRAGYPAHAPYVDPRLLELLSVVEELRDVCHLRPYGCEGHRDGGAVLVRTSNSNGAVSKLTRAAAPPISAISARAASTP